MTAGMGQGPCSGGGRGWGPRPGLDLPFLKPRQPFHQKIKEPLGVDSANQRAFLGRWLIPHQSATVMPMVNSDSVSTVTLTCFPVNRSGCSK